MGRNIWTDNSASPEEARHQEAAVKSATAEGFKYAGLTLAATSTVVLGAAKLFPRFNKSLSVSSKTALIVTPVFGVYFLMAEFEMNARKRERRELAARAARQNPYA